MYYNNIDTFYSQIILLFPLAFGQSHQKSNDPNNEPFLPIFPVYPYNPKLMKRGVDKETETQLSAELYAPKVDARDSYTPNYSSNYQRDPYYPNYDPYPKTTFSSSSTSPSSSSYSPYYTNNPQTTTSYSTLPYNVYNTYTNPYTSSTSHSSIPSTAYSPSSYSTTAYPSSYTSNPYTASPSAYQAPPYVPVSSYYYQQPYYYPSYYAPALYPPPPPPPPLPHSDYSKDSDSDNKESYEKDSSKSKKSKNVDKNQDSSNNEYVDGGNYISTNSKDLDSQSSSYKSANKYNKLEQTNNNPREENSGSETYKIIKLSSQPSDTEYSIAATYAKTQQLEQLMRQTLAKLLAENAARQIIQYPTYDTKQNLLIKANEVYGGLGDYDTRNTQTFVTASNPIVKNGLNYAINSNNLGNINSGSILPRPVYQNLSPRSIKYSEDQYHRKPITMVTLQQSQGSYIPPNKSVKSQISAQSSSYDGYENQDKVANHNYDSTLDSTEGKQEQDYDQSQTGSSYKSQNYVTVQTPQSYSYQYASYHPQQTTNQQGSQEYDDTTTDVEFGAKQNSKG
ncbi:hypothetical protein M0802_004465 [Mischocyttarus mexicanus]|nr:hypothetical protein M0802_004465 [Mischocyttarus mexicanus]